MARHLVSVYLECGAKRTFAGALDWPGWCRQGANESEALAALLAYGQRYGAILSRARLGFAAPEDLDQLAVVERLRGTPGTDFGVISVPPAVDHDRSIDHGEVKRLEKILRAGWRAFDETVKAARGRKLSTGPRGGGRSLQAIVSHVIEADTGYLGAVGWKAPKTASSSDRIAATREAILEALEASASGKVPAKGPRGGARWSARFFVRRIAWHVYGHAWEIERRAGLHPGPHFK
jgi:hypothetical protein